MKIGLYISNLKGGGAQRVVSRLSEILSKDNDVYLILNDSTNIFYSYNATLIDINEPATQGIVKVKRAYQRIKKLKKIKKRYNLNVVISFLSGQNIVNVLSKVPSCKSYVSIRNFQKAKFSSTPFGNFFYSYMGRIYKKANFVIPCSKLIANEIINSFDISEEKVGVLYNPYNQVELNSLASQKPESEYLEFKESHEFVFVTSGRFDSQKGYWHLLKIIKLLNDKKLNIGLFIIGTGKQEEKIKALISDLELSDNVMLCGFQENPFSIENLSDSYIMTSLFEGFPNALVEAMCIGLPIISSDCLSGPREILAPNMSLESTTDSKVNAKYGILLKQLSAVEDWTINIDECEIEWANYIYSIISNHELDKYNDLSKVRASSFSYENCLSTINNYISN